MNALIVDDHEIVRDGLAQLLKDAFPVHSILYASDGREAIQKALNYDIDLVLLDLSMPEGLDGLLALQEIRKIIPKAKIIIFTMYDDIYYQKKDFSFGGGRLSCQTNEKCGNHQSHPTNPQRQENRQRAGFSMKRNWMSPYGKPRFLPGNRKSLSSPYKAIHKKKLPIR